MPAAANGRAWSSILAGGVVEKWGTSVILAGTVGMFLWMQHVRDQTQLANQAAERKLHSENISSQRKTHTEQVDKLLTLIIQEVIKVLTTNEVAIRENGKSIASMSTLIKSIDENAAATRELAIQSRQKQEDFIPTIKRLQAMIERLLKIDTSDLETIPPGRRRPPFEGTGPQ